ncbi:hypothetical protein FRC02_007585 [Tulasnella sp. 418]|nr:hypothetical protein FRC02_007585 [Tulasnella sp. 418]
MDYLVGRFHPQRSRSLPPTIINHLATEEDLPLLTTKQTAELASVFYFFWNWSINASLDYTSVSSSTILASMSGVFTLGIGRLLNVEVFTLAKFGAVVTSFLGVLLVSMADSNLSISDSSTSPSFSLLLRTFITDPSNDHAPNPLLGDFLAIISALFYALYVTLLKIRIKTESRIDMQLFFGFVGLFNVLTLWPVAMLLNYMGWEVLEWPSGGKTWAVVAINVSGSQRFCQNNIMSCPFAS